MAIVPQGRDGHADYRLVYDLYGLTEDEIKPWRRRDERRVRMSDYHINVFYSDQDRGYIADIPDLKYCSAFGETPEEAVREVMLAGAAWLEARRGARGPQA